MVMINIVLWIMVGFMAAICSLLVPNSLRSYVLLVVCIISLGIASILEGLKKTNEK